MYVCIDIEWFPADETTRRITQMAVCRVTEHWECVAEFSCLVRPLDPWHCDWEHMAYNGYSPDEFTYANDEENCMRRLVHFLKEDDVLCVWSRDSKNILLEKYAYYTGKSLPNDCLRVDKQVYQVAKCHKLGVFEMYAVAEAIGIDTPAPKHCCVNDVTVLMALLSTLHIQPKKVPIIPIPVVKKIVSKQERNADILARSQYNFVFAPGSSIFHKPSCKCILKANHIQGSVYYKTVAKYRRPCKLCRPDLAPTIIPPPKQSPQIPYHTSENPCQNIVVTAKLLGNRKVQINQSKLVGFCHNIIHPGKLTAKIMEQHDCIRKQCKFFEKYVDSPYWIAQEQKRQQKIEQKYTQQKQKQEAEQLACELEKMRELFQYYADDFSYAIYLVRIQKISRNRYKIFYVSENQFADGNQFPYLIETIHYFFPKYKIELRHIKDMDGHFVTIDEYHAWKGRKR